MKIENKNPKIIILSGKARAGKDTSASFIKKYYEEKGLKVANLQFSFYIKMYAKILSNWDGSEETKPRTLLQTLGTDVIRDHIDNYFFIKRIIDDIKVLSYFVDVITISDARLPEELDEVAKAYPNTTKINIIRPGFDNNLNQKENMHRTETSLNDYKDYTYEIINDDTLDALENKIIDIIKELK